MTPRPKILLVGDADGWREAFRQRAGAAFEVELVGPHVDAAEHGAARPHRPHEGAVEIAGAFVELAAEPAAGLSAIARLREAHPEAPIVAVAGDKDPELILRAMRAGAGEFLLFGETAAHLEALHRFVGRHGRSATVVTCLPARGGVGASMVAANLAAAISLEGFHVALADLDFHLGDVLLLLDLDPRMTIAELLADEDRLDGELLMASLPRHGSGVWAVSQAGPIEDRDRVAPADIPRLVAVLRRHFDFVILDGVRGFGAATLAALDVTDRLLLVLTQEIQSVKNAQLCLRYLRGLGFEDEKIKVVVNRVHQRGATVELEGVEEFLGRPIAGRIANDYSTVSRAIARGQLLADEAPRSQVARDVAALAELLTGHHERRPSGLLRQIFGHKPAAPPEVEPPVEEKRHGAA
jgi:pilus assembly protein CpaE